MPVHQTELIRTSQEFTISQNKTFEARWLKIESTNLGYNSIKVLDNVDHNLFGEDPSLYEDLTF